LRWLAEHTAADYLMVCEDDVAYCRAARAAWEQSLRQLDSVGFWSLYTPRRDQELVGQKSGWVASNRGRDTWGTQCLSENGTGTVPTTLAYAASSQARSRTRMVLEGKHSIKHNFATRVRVGKMHNL
jgi:hypothetical protein